MTHQQDILDRLAGDCPSKNWIRAHLDYPHKEWCLLYPMSRIQSGYVKVASKAMAGHRLMCEYRNGRPPSPKHQAAHSCGRGHDGCLNPWHLSWKTNAENQLERYQHSGLTKRTKLTPAQVDEIRALEGRASVSDIAKKYGVIPLTIHRIYSGKLWNGTSTNWQVVLTEQQVWDIRSTPWQQKSARQWAEQLGVNRNVIDRVRAGLTYKWVPDRTTELPRPNIKDEAR